MSVKRRCSALSLGLFLAMFIAAEPAGGTSCGNFIIEFGEICDGSTLPSGTPPGSRCNSTCSAILPPPSLPLPLPRGAALGCAVGLLVLGFGVAQRRLPRY
ncbi:MAG TPA: hypothetical protein VJU61_23600 [Polyangiaceae bacterium]|nr:hypothetical protein [Polyangiaceae bacterium]